MILMIFKVPLQNYLLNAVLAEYVLTSMRQRFYFQKTTQTGKRGLIAKPTIKEKQRDYLQKNFFNGFEFHTKEPIWFCLYFLMVHNFIQKNQ